MAISPKHLLSAQQALCYLMDHGFRPEDSVEVLAIAVGLASYDAGIPIEDALKPALEVHQQLVDDDHLQKWMGS